MHKDFEPELLQNKHRHQNRKKKENTTPFPKKLGHLGQLEMSLFANHVNSYLIGSRTKTTYQMLKCFMKNICSI